MTTSTDSAAATGLPEAPLSTWDAVNAIAATAGDIKHLIDILASQVCELTAPADTANYGCICRANAVARSLETLTKVLEEQCDEAYDAIRQEPRS